MGYAMSDKGGNLLAIFELDASNAILPSYTNGTNCLHCGLIDTSGVDIAAKVEKYEAEDGITYGQDETYEGTTNGILKETDKLKVDYLSFGVRDKIHLEYKYEGKKNGKHQEVFKIVDVTPQMSFKTKGGTKSMKYDSTAIPQKTAFVLTAGALSILAAGMPSGFAFKCSTFTLAVDREHVIVETAVS